MLQYKGTVVGDYSEMPKKYLATLGYMEDLS